MGKFASVRCSAVVDGEEVDDDDHARAEEERVALDVSDLCFAEGVAQRCDAAAETAHYETSDQELIDEHAGRQQEARGTKTATSGATSLPTRLSSVLRISPPRRRLSP